MRRRIGRRSGEILLGDGVAEAAIVGDELGQELVQARPLEDVGDRGVLQPGADRARGALGRALAAIGERQLVEKARRGCRSSSRASAASAR